MGVADKMCHALEVGEAAENKYDIRFDSIRWLLCVAF